MTDHLTVTRTAEFDLSTDELWALVSDGRRWTEWMVDESDVVVTPGGEGLVVDEGVRRAVLVQSVGNRRLVFEWRPIDGDHDASSTVEIEVTPLDDEGGSRLRVVETSASADTGLAWDVRLLAMCCCVAACCRT